MKLPAGDYYIGDPCYVLAADGYPDDRWSKFCNLLYDHNKQREVTEFEGVPMYAAGTANGDGEFLGTDNFAYGVDAGLIGIVPLSLCTDTARLERAKEHALGRFVTFTKEFEAESNGEGVFYFDDIVINTGYMDEEEGEYDYEEEGDDYEEEEGEEEREEETT